MQVKRIHPRKFVWTPDSVRYFHDYLGTASQYQETFFAKEVGLGITRLVNTVTPITGKILDFGCGPGYLMDYLDKYPVQVWGADASPASVAAANFRNRNKIKWQGATALSGTGMPFSRNFFDIIFVLETIEHLLAGSRKSTLLSLKKLLKPGSGLLFISTPNREDLNQSLILCPNCRQLFHRYQHQTSFSSSSLSRLMSGLGYRTRVCRATDFSRVSAGIIRRFFSRTSSAPPPHLYWLGDKGG